MRLTARHITHSYESAPSSITRVLDDICLSVAAGERCAILGPSGSGKSTLLAILALTLKATAGQIEYEGELVTPTDEFALQRRAIMMQTTNVLNYRSAVGNVAAALIVRGIDHDTADSLALDALDAVGLLDRAQVRAYQLSGGERQRVAVARCLVARTPLVFADEPTAQLDRRTADVVAEMLVTTLPLDAALVVATHDQAVAEQCGRVYSLRGGKLHGSG